MEKSKINLQELLTKVSDEKINLSCESAGNVDQNQKSWSWSVTDSKSWSNQSWRK